MYKYLVTYAYTAGHLDNAHTTHGRVFPIYDHPITQEDIEEVESEASQRAHVWCTVTSVYLLSADN